MVWICVGTPSDADGGINLSSVRSAAADIGAFLQSAHQRPLIVLRSTVLPGSTRDLFIPGIEQTSGLVEGRDFDVVFHPEFLREGTAVEDFDSPPKIVVGENRPGASAPLLAAYPDKYQAPRFVLNVAEAELVKYYDNLFHAVKITFANELGAVARAAGVDARRVAEVFCADRKLNISPYYLRPGFAFGGSCLPKDLRALLRHSALQSVRMPMLEAVPASNALQIERLVTRVVAGRHKSVGMIGLAFKPHTDDMRESPYVTVAKRLIGEGLTLRVYDPGVHPDRLIGSNKEAVQAALQHLEALLVPSLDQLDECDAMIINHATIEPNRVNRWLEQGRRVIDLVGVLSPRPASPNYEGIAW
jgi:GDP-mannose 6-dehydrogenase